jgi:uncharacterized protein (DUF58 family)
VNGTPEQPWRPTPAHARAVVMAFGCIGVAVVVRRPDLLVLGAPFLGVAALGAVRRPDPSPAATFTVDAVTVAEGQRTTARTRVPAIEPGCVVTAMVRGDPWVRLDPPSGARTAAAGEARVVDVGVRAVRWGRRTVELSAVVATSPLGAYRSVAGHRRDVTVTALPIGVDLELERPMPRPAGLVGRHRARHHGEGSELAEVRPFRVGDRLRRINWPVSSRTQQLHVNATWADRDTEVVLLLDTEHDLGRTEGVDGLASSLDTTVRAAAAIADQALRGGDRVGLVDLGRRVRTVPAGGGRRHLRHLLGVLVDAEPGAVSRPEDRPMPRVRPGALVVALTTLTGAAGRTEVARLVQRGHSVVVVDTMPDGPARPDQAARTLARRLRALERESEIDRLRELGVPVVRWRGRRTLDEVLRVVERAANAPRWGSR